jgi:ABC-type phosphate/phosphonate transport system substrate-binding protein
MSSSILIACSRMYNISPKVIEAWETFFLYISAESGVRFEIIEHPFPNPIEDLWKLPNMGCVMMCGFPYARSELRPKLLAAAVPSPSHYEGKSVYYSHLLVAENSKFQTIEDTFGHSICWTIENSQSGFNAIRNFLLPFRTVKHPTLYKEAIGPIGTFTVGIEALREGNIDVVPIDSFSYDLMKRHAPGQLAGTRVIATTPPTPFPPLVAGYDIEHATFSAIREIVLDTHQSPRLKAAMDVMMIQRFNSVEPHDYDVLLDQANLAEAAGYPAPA